MNQPWWHNQLPGAPEAHPETDPAGLTPTEQSVEALTLQGFSIDATAARLGLSRGTVKVYRCHIYRKRGVHSLAELLRKQRIPLVEREDT